jgi:hypothetical protein
MRCTSILSELLAGYEKPEDVLDEGRLSGR